MKNILFLLIFVVNIFALPDCCLKYKYDSLKAIKEYIRSPYPCRPTTFFPSQDAGYNSNTCEKFQYTYMTTCGNNDVIETTYRFNFYKLDSITYVKTLLTIMLNTRTRVNVYPVTPNDTVKNWCRFFEKC